jgi:hypothetical protein
VDTANYTVAIVNGVGIYNVSGLAYGPHNVFVKFIEDNKYQTSENTTTFNVLAKDLNDLNVNVTAQNVTVEQNTSFSIFVPDDFKGNVSITVGTDVLYNGTVQNVITAAKLLAGDKFATVVFYGDANYNKTTLENVRFTVSRVTPVVTVQIDNVTYPGKAVAVINVDNNANGTVNVTVDGKVFNGTVINGVARVNLTGLSAGFKEALVEFFTGDDYNNNATGSAAFTVFKNTSNITIAVNEIYRVGDNIVITLAPVNSTGAVTVTINGKKYTVLTGLLLLLLVVCLLVIILSVRF